MNNLSKYDSVNKQLKIKQAMLTLKEIERHDIRKQKAITHALTFIKSLEDSLSKKLSLLERVIKNYNKTEEF